MTLSPDADKAQVRQAVIDLQEWKDSATAWMQVQDDRIKALEEEKEEHERRIELLSNALKSTLTSRAEPTRTEPRKLPEPVPGKREPRPIGDGQKYWTDENGFSVPAETIADEFRARYREPGTPRAEDIP